MKLKYILLAFLSLLNIFASCEPRLYSPPTRLWSLETPGSLSKGQNSVTAAGGKYIGYDFLYDKFDFSAFSLALQFRRGITDNFEGCGSVAFLYVDPQEYTPPDTFTTVAGSIRAGAKYNFAFAKRVLAVRGGIGLGTSKIGQYFGIDLGTVVGFENPYLVPFLTGGYYLSLPFNTEIVDFGLDEDSMGLADEAELTNGWEFGGGVRAGPFSFPNSRYNQALAIYVLGAWTQLRSPNHREGDSPISIGGGVEWYFGGKEEEKQ